MSKNVEGKDDKEAALLREGLDIVRMIFNATDVAAQQSDNLVKDVLSLQ